MSGEYENNNGNGNPYLGRDLDAILKHHLAELGARSLDHLTVMAKHRDPYRLEKYRPEAEWFAEQVAKVPHLPIHVRGLHYAAIGDRKPDGMPYRNSEEDYKWMQDRPAKAGRFLGTVPFTAIVDQKNDAPHVELFFPPNPARAIQVGGVEVMLPDDLEPRAVLRDFRGTQPFNLVIFAEKSAVKPVLMPVAERFGADTYFEGGEISDTHLYDMAARGHADGRPMIVLTFCDADPAGYWMPCVVARKLQALRDNWFPELTFAVHPVGLLPDQVKAIDAENPENPLPSSPLKAGEKRAGAWEQALGIEQIELDAIATLRPEVLRQIAINGIKPFHDASLDRRVREVREQWEQEAQAALEDQLGDDVLERIRDEVQGKLDELQELATEINEELWIPTDGINLPPTPQVPDPVLNGVPSPLAWSEDGYVDLTLALKQRGAYAKDKAQ